MAEMDERELREAAEEAELTRDDPYPADAPAPTRPALARSRVLQVRLNPDEYAALERLATEREAPTSAVARGWILDGLRGSVTVEDRWARIERRLDQIERRLAS